MAERIKALPEEERQWLEVYVKPIILPEEKNLFVQLTEPHQREIFKEDFWKRREQQGLPEPLGPGYRNRYEGFREAAETTYGGINSDTGKMVVLRGEPAGIQEFLDCNNVFRDLAVWTYAQTGGVSGFHRDLQYLFYRPSTSSGPLEALAADAARQGDPASDLLPQHDRRGLPAGGHARHAVQRHVLPAQRRAADVRRGLRDRAHRPEHPPDRGRPDRRRDLRAAEGQRRRHREARRAVPDGRRRERQAAHVRGPVGSTRRRRRRPRPRPARRWFPRPRRRRSPTRRRRARPRPTASSRRRRSAS